MKKKFGLTMQHAYKGLIKTVTLLRAHPVYFSCRFSRLCVAFCESAWSCMAFLWSCIAFYGFCYDLLWYFMVFYGSSMVLYDLLWQIIYLFGPLSFFSRGHRSKFIWSCSTQDLTILYIMCVQYL